MVVIFFIPTFVYIKQLKFKVMVEINLNSDNKIGSLSIENVDFSLLEWQRKELYAILDNESNGLNAVQSDALEGVLNFLNEICDPYVEKIGWVCTDPSCNQYRKDISETVFLFKEDRIINPETKETKTVEMEINIDNYTWYQIIDACNTFGYTPEQTDKWLTEGEEFALIAECLFELEDL